MLISVNVFNMDVCNIKDFIKVLNNIFEQDWKEKFRTKSNSVATSNLLPFPMKNDWKINLNHSESLYCSIKTVILPLQLETGRFTRDH